MLTVRHPITGNWEQIPGVSPPWSQGDQTPTRENNVQDAACPDSAPQVYKWVIYVLLIYLKKTWVCFNCKGWANILKVEQRPLSKSEALLRSPELPLISETTQGGWVRSSHSKSDYCSRKLTQKGAEGRTMLTLHWVAMCPCTCYRFANAFVQRYKALSL